MARIYPFEKYTERYDNWFDRHEAVYQSELSALREIMVHTESGMEVGVGTGRFAVPLGIETGIDPSMQMLKYARRRGVKTVCAVAEALPFRDGVFENVLIVTTICFVDDAVKMMNEVHRVLKHGGTATIGFIDRESHLGRYYEEHREEKVFYKDATFFSVNEVRQLLFGTDFDILAWRQTITKSPDEITESEPPEPGTGNGAFVAVRAIKS